MHPTLVAIQQELERLISVVASSIPRDEPLAIVHGNWSFPGLSRSELIEEARSIIVLINDRGGDSIPDDALLKDYVRRVAFLSQHTAPQMWGNAGQAISAYILTLAGLKGALAPALKQEDHIAEALKLKQLASKVRSMEARLRGLEPRTTSLTKMVDRIERAYQAAEQLPTDLESLSEARDTIEDILKQATKDLSRLSNLQEHVEELNKKLEQSVYEANDVLQRCETAYSAATSVGLAAAFSERSRNLSHSMWIWVSGLVLALLLGSIFGSIQLRQLSGLFTAPDTSPSIILLNLVLSMLSIGAPVWFAWLATKQIGQRFRLAEDYAFKASISRAYEGFRREAARFDKDMEEKLLSSALTRLDELPLRLVEPISHGSPWHELASSDAVKKALQAIPEFADQVKDLAAQAIGARTSRSFTKDSPLTEDR